MVRLTLEQYQKHSLYSVLFDKGTKDLSGKKQNRGNRGACHLDYSDSHGKWREGGGVKMYLGGETGSTW